MYHMHMSDFELSPEDIYLYVIYFTHFLVQAGYEFLRKSQFFVSYQIIMFLGSKMGFLGMPNAMAQVRGLSAHSLAILGPKCVFLDIFLVCLHFLTVHSVPLSFCDMILHLQTSYIFSGILLKIIFSILFVVPSKKPYEWPEGIKK